ncbi:MAG: nucleotide sugar dehydrogenase [Gomphosphaeria aponina SAG 52.96 = DSM 107014]|uniref:Nucleotide sugar dehydrogenase n=1 Tax=Gomphosphaeria aponina SAG 52.96 = DSM 107014 TaxID=1521640 RepID=A0A941JUE2_9CHRO|nr:nucleotide sugar dehydrogenase [Gomphosphaeria aponina SAG 52.96 = DSM 107014]
MKHNLLEKLQSKNATIGIIGLGYVGLPLLLSFAESGLSVIGFDIDSEKVQMLNKGESYIKHISKDRLIHIENNQNFQATCDFALIKDADCLIICVPTPLGMHNDPNLSFIIKTINEIQPYLRQGQLISLESTTYPGTTEEEIKPKLEKQGFKIGEDIFLVYSPEREDPGNEKYTTKTIPKVVAGLTDNCLEIGIELYSKIVKTVIPVSCPKVAEMSKLLENIYRAVNIGLVNELKIVCDHMGIDIWEVIKAASTKPFGFTPFYPGPGLGGHCIPIDPFYLTWKAKEYKIHTRFIELAGQINTNMPKWVVEKITDALNNHSKSIKGSKILVLGIAYKKNIDDSRESPAVEIMQLLHNKGANISYCDPYFPKFPKMRMYKFDLKSVELTEEIIKKQDCLVIATDHDLFDYQFIQQNSKLVIDTRGRYQDNLINVVKS